MQYHNMQLQTLSDQREEVSIL